MIDNIEPTKATPSPQSGINRVVPRKNLRNCKINSFLSLAHEQCMTKKDSSGARIVASYSWGQPWEFADYKGLITGQKGL